MNGRTGRGAERVGRRRPLTLNADALLFFQNVFIGISPYLLSTGLSCAVPVFSRIYDKGDSLLETYALAEWAAVLLTLTLSPLLFIKGRYESQAYMLLLHTLTAANGLLSATLALFWNVSTNGTILYAGGYLTNTLASLTLIVLYGTLAINDTQCVALSLGFAVADFYGAILDLLQEQSESPSIVGLTYVFVLPVVFQVGAIIFIHSSRYVFLRARGASLFLDSLEAAGGPSFVRPAMVYSRSSLVPSWYGPLAIFASCSLSSLLVTRFAFDFTADEDTALLEIMLFHVFNICGRLLSLLLRGKTISLYQLVLLEFLVFSMELLLCMYAQPVSVSLPLVLAHGLLHGMVSSAAFFSRPQLSAKLLRKKYDGRALDDELDAMESLRAQNESNWNSELPFGVLAEYKTDVQKATAIYKKGVAICSLLGSTGGAAATWCVGRYLEGGVELHLGTKPWFAASWVTGAAFRGL